jgi:endonuclease/exonuclease/phosphatase family metal-dependent hydrolase
MTFPIDAVATADAIAYDSPSNATNFGSRSAMWVQGVSNQRRAFVYMARPFPLDSNVVTSRLRLTVDRAAASASRTISVQLVSKSWSESRLTWDNQPGVVGPVASVTVTGALVAGQVIEVDVQALMQLVSTGTPWYGFRIVSSSSSAVYFRSREATSGTPRLVGSYSQAPMPPSALSPSAGRAVSVARPTLSFDFTDRTGSMTAYQVRGFSGEGAGISAPAGMSERVASFNYNGIVRSGVPSWATRKPLIIDTMFNSGASLIGCQEANSTSSGDDQPAVIVAGMNAEAGSSGQWETFIGSNLNVIFNDAAVFEARWAKTQDKRLGDGKYAVAMLFKHKASGAEFIFCTTHYLTSSELTKQIAHTKVLISFTASLQSKYDVPVILTGDFNAKQKTATRPIGMLTQAGHIDVRDLVEPEDITNAQYNSLDSYDPNDMLGYWIDHIFVSGGPEPTAVGLLDSGNASDHNLIWADIDYVTATATVADLGEITYNTGATLSTTPRHTLTRDLAEGEIFAWQVRVKDETDWSGWSEVAFFTRVSALAVSITNPAAAPDNFVSEPTPPFSWITVGQQTAYRVIITDPEDKTNILYDTRRQGGSDQSWTPPSNLPLEDGRDYRLVVRVEDDVVREATPGDPTYTQVERIFTFDLTTAVAPATNFDVIQVDERPWATVSFRMSTMPDAVELRRDGRSLGTFDPADLLVSGTTYEFVDRTATPFREHTWSVRRVVNGQTSKTNPAFTGKIESEGVWLSLPDGSISVCVSGDPVEWSADEVVELFRPMGATRARIVTHGVFGREGRLNGFVEAIPGITYEEQRTAWYALANRSRFPYGTEMVLTQSDGVTRVFWSNVLTVERSEFHDDFGVSATLNEIR